MGLSIEQRLANLEAEVRSLRAVAPKVAPVPVDLDGDKYANFVVRRTPSNWLKTGGHDYAGTHIADTSPEFCECLAEYLDWGASRDEEKNYSYVNGKGVTVFPAKYARLDAARARAWAKRLRGVLGTSTVAKQLPLAPQEDSNDIPF